MDQSKKEKQQQQKENEIFNSVTQKGKVENQNQTHNVKKMGIAPKNQYK